MLPALLDTSLRFDRENITIAAWLRRLTTFLFNLTKKSGSNHAATKDSQIAKPVFNSLEKRGFKVFWSDESLKREVQRSFMTAITRALESAAVLVVVGTSVDNVQAPFVQHEWGLSR
jgi:hypothetical protein